MGSEELHAKNAGLRDELFGRREIETALLHKRG